MVISDRIVKDCKCDQSKTSLNFIENCCVLIKKKCLELCNMFHKKCTDQSLEPRSYENSIFLKRKADNRIVFKCFF